MAPLVVAWAVVGEGPVQERGEEQQVDEAATEGDLVVGHGEAPVRRMVLGVETVLAPDSPRLSRGRFVRTDRGIYDTWGRFFIADELWACYARDGRSDRADHDFQLQERLEEEVPDQWHRVRAVCLRCREQRLVFHGVDVDDLNREWCVPTPGDVVKYRLVCWVLSRRWLP